MAILDSSIVNIAIPKLKTVFSVNTAQVQWIVTIYMLTLGVVVPAANFLGERFGYRAVYIVSLIVFTIGSALCGLSWSLGVLTVFRVLQALGGGLIMPVTMAMIYRIVPRERIGTAMGFWGLAVIFAPALGPALGGYLVQYIDWRLIFYINVPIGVIGVLLALGFVPRIPGHSRIPFDAPGFVMAAAGLFGLLLAFSEGQTWGWSSEPIVLLLVGSVWILILFVLWELYTPNPLLNVRVFKYGSFSVSSLLVVIVIIGMYSGVFYVPLFLQTVSGYGALETGLIMMPSALASALMMPIAGRLYDRIGGRPLALFGLAMISVTTYFLHNLSPNTPLTTVMWWLVVRGVGMGAAIMPITTAGMSAVPTEHVGSGSAINNIMQRVGGSFGLALMTALLQRQTTIHAQTIGATYTPSAPMPMHAWNLLSALYAGHVPTGLASRMTVTTLHGMVQQQAFVMGIDDIFVAAAIISVLGVLISFFLRTYRTDAKRTANA